MPDTISIALTDLMATPTLYPRICRRIAKWHKSLKMTQLNLTARLNIAQQTQAHYEGGLSQIAVETSTQVAEILSTNIEEIIVIPVKPGTSRRGTALKLQQQFSRLPNVQLRMAGQCRMAQTGH